MDPPSCTKSPIHRTQWNHGRFQICFRPWLDLIRTKNSHHLKLYPIGGHIFSDRIFPIPRPKQNLCYPFPQNYHFSAFINIRWLKVSPLIHTISFHFDHFRQFSPNFRSEERRVGKESRSEVWTNECR